MKEHYSFIEDKNYLAIELELDIGRKLRNTPMSQKLFLELKKQGGENKKFLKYGYIKGSCLLESISIEGISGCIIHMIPKQYHNYFSYHKEQRRKIEFPKELGHRGIIYVPHNILGEEPKDFKKLWEIYFNKVIQEIK